MWNRLDTKRELDGQTELVKQYGDEYDVHVTRGENPCFPVDR